MIRFHAWLAPLLVATGGVVDLSSRFGPGAIDRRAWLDDGQILAELDHAFSDEIKCAALVLERATVPGVRALASRFQADLSAVRVEEREIAARLRASPRTQPIAAVADSHEAVMADLKAMKSPDFDRAYVEHEIGSHQVLLDHMTKSMVPTALSPEVKALLEKIGPMLKSHIEQAKNAKDSLPKV